MKAIRYVQEIMIDGGMVADQTDARASQRGRNFFK